MTFSTGVYEHPQFELFYLLSKLYKGCPLTLSIDFLILNIWLFIEASIFKTYFSQYHTPLYHHRVVHWSEHISLRLTISYPLYHHRVVHWSEHISLRLTISYSPRLSHGKTMCSFLISIEFGSLRFYVSLLHRDILTIVTTLISYNSC
jgi:hypothetical protein